MEGSNPVVAILLRIGIYMAFFIFGIVVVGYIVSKLMNKGFSLSELLDRKLSKGKNIDPFWPTMKDKETAIIVARNSSYFIFFIAVLTGILYGFQIFGLSRYGLIDTLLLVIIGIGLFNMSRIAAVAGLSLYIISKIYALLAYLAIPQAFWIILVVLTYINGIRATFAYHKLEPDEKIIESE